MLELIQPISKRDQVVRAMKQAILSGSIEPGASIVESKIAQQLGAGVPLIREALIELEHQGFVQRTPYKGTTVTKLSAADVRHIFALRVELEAIAIEWAKERASPSDLDSLRQEIRKMEDAAKALDLPQFYEGDLSFHRKIWSLSGNPYLVDMLERLVVPLFAFFLMKTSRQQKSYVESACMHAEIVEAMAVKSAIEMREMFKNSLVGWKDDMVKLLFEGEE
ncbi:MAG TPA: GntR family transcriptional regulator [Pyrinomonadaceae bacterium]|nr:GntR family transcriptional regulator [Pyrinomonadaceae bacterium]